MTNRIATEAEIASIDSWAENLGTVGSQAAIDISFGETFDPNNSEWITLTAVTQESPDADAVLTVTYNSSVLDEESGTFNTTDVTKTFSIDVSLVPDDPEPAEDSEE